MSTILNKSNHPVEVKRVDVRIWKLRDEIEAAIAQRVYEEGNSETPSETDIEDIKKFYIDALNSPPSGAQEEEQEAPSEEAALDSSGNPLDDDALAMMAALNGDAEDTPDDKVDEPQNEASAEEEATEQNPEDDEAAKLAAQMLGDQGVPAPTEEDDEASKLAAQMLADQGMGDSGADDEAANLAAQMLEGQGAPPPPQASRPPFKRVTPSEDKVTSGFVLLSDIQMDQIMVFTANPFVHGQNIIVEFLVPNSFTQILEVVTTLNIARNSKIISPTKPGFRVQSQFMFKFPGERSHLRSFLQSVEPTIPDPPTKLKRPDGDEGDDDFDDLDF